MSNTYARTFEATCPNNGAAIRYRLLITTAGRFIAAEDIIAATDAIGSGFHEAIADALLARFGGTQTLVAHHHGVDITTVRMEARS